MSVSTGPRDGLMTSNGVSVPLDGVGVNAEVFGLCARVELTQRFVNREATPIEAVYTFPLDEGAAVCAFEAIIDNTLVVGEIKERDAAFNAYDTAIAAGHGAYLIDQDRPDVFTASIGNLPPGKEVLIRLVYVTALPVEGMAVRFVVPTTVSPRYAPAADRLSRGASAAERLNPPVAWHVPYGLHLQVRLTMEHGPASVDSPSHPIRVSWEGQVATVVFSHASVAMDRDFVLLAEIGGLEAPRAWVERDDDGTAAAAVAFRPRLADSPVASEIIFLIDRSGSMGGSSIAEVRSALQLCLRSIPAGSRFNIIGFGSEFRPLFAESVPYDDSSLAVANSYVEQLDADMGGTEILDPIRFAFECPRYRELPRQIVLLTDGQVTNTDAVVQFAADHADRARVFTFGIGAGASHHLMRALARATGGAAEAIYPGERIAPKVLRQFRRLSSPAVTNVQLDWGGLRATQAPSTIRAVFSGDCVVVYAFIEDFAPATVRLTGSEALARIGFDIPLTERRVSTGGTIAALAARERIRELEECPGVSRRGSLQSRPAHEAAAQIVAIAKKYGLMSRETSFVAVEQRTTPVLGNLQLRRVPVALTTGWGGLSHPMPPAMPPGASAMAAPSAPMPQLMANMSAHSMGIGFMRRLASLRPTPRVPAMRSSTPAQPSKPSRTPLDVLVGLQRADGSWELTGELALVLGTTRSRLQAANVRAATHRCWATALAIAWLRRHGADRGHEWALLARKAAAWLDDRAGAAEAAALIRAAAVVCGSADTNRVQVAGSTQS